MCSTQNQDGKGVSSVSDFELSELMKRRLESVASTGSSASSGFIEDKSYSDSEEEEEGKGLARLCSPLSPSPLPSPPHSGSPQIPDATFPPPVQQHNHCSRSRCHPTESVEATVYFLSWPYCCCALGLRFRRGTSAVLYADVLFLVWLAVYSGGLVEGLLVSPPPLISRLGPGFTWHHKNRRNCNLFFISVKDVLKTERVGGDVYTTGWIVKMMGGF